MRPIKSGLRIAIDLKDDAKPEAILAYLMSKTQLQTNYTANMVAIVDGHPRVDGSCSPIAIATSPISSMSSPGGAIPFQNRDTGPSFDREWPHQS
jgi:hypothetical protein